MSCSSSSIKRSFKIYTFGNNGYGRLGIGCSKNKDVVEPTLLSFKEENNVCDIAIGSAQNLLLTLEGHVYSWGKCHYGQLGHGERDQDESSPKKIEKAPKNVEKISCGTHTCYLIDEQGDVYSFGFGFFGSLGHNNEKHYCTPQRIEFFHAYKHQIGAVVAGDRHAIAMNRDGSLLFAWGDNKNGQLGLGTDIKTRKVPTIVDRHHISNSAIQSIAVGGQHSMITTKDGKAYSCGLNDHYQLGHSDKEKVSFTFEQIQWTPDKSTPLKTITCHASGFHSFLVINRQALFSFGDNRYAQLGHPNISSDIKVPTQVEAIQSHQSILSIGTGTKHTMVICAAHKKEKRYRLFGFGCGEHGQNGRRLNEAILYEPTLVPCAKDNEMLIKVACGTNHTIVLSK